MPNDRRIASDASAGALMLTVWHLHADWHGVTFRRRGFKASESRKPYQCQVPIGGQPGGPLSLV